MKTFYDEKLISSQYDILVQKMKKGEKLQPVDIQFGAAAGHALDALGLSRDIKHPLDLNEMNDKTVNTIIVALYMYFSGQKESSSAIREKLSKKIGSFLLFATNNEVNRVDNLTAELVSKGSMLYCRVTDNNNSVNFIDVLGITDNFIKKDLKFDPKAGTIVITDASGLTGKIKACIESLKS